MRGTEKWLHRIFAQASLMTLLPSFFPLHHPHRCPSRVLWPQPGWQEQIMSNHSPAQDDSRGDCAAHLGAPELDFATEWSSIPISNRILLLISSAPKSYNIISVSCDGKESPGAGFR